MRRAMGLMVLLVGCANPDFVSQNGVEVFLNGTSDLDYFSVSAMEGALIQSLLYPDVGTDSDREASLKLHFYTSRRAEVIACFKHATVDMSTELIPYTDENGKEFGVLGLERRGLLLLKTDACAYRTAYIHELMHWIQDCVDSPFPSDRHHEEPMIWDVVVPRAEMRSVQWCK